MTRSPRGSKTPATLASGETVWRLRWDVPPKAGQTRSQERATFRGSERDAARELAERIAEAWGGGPQIDRTTTLRDYLAEWLAHYRRRRRPNSYTAREQIVRLHIVPHLGHYKLAELRPKLIQRWIDGREDAGLAPNYVRDMLGTLRTALNQAVAWELLVRNPAAAVEAPGKGESAGVAWTVDEARKFFDHQRASPDFAMWCVAGNGQLRRCEIAGLRWEDVDTDRGLIRIERQLVPVKGGGLATAPPKSAKSKRVLPMAKDVMAVLARHRVDQERRRGELEPLGLWSADDGWVFDRGDGHGLHPQTVYERFKKACHAADVRVVRLHDLRHTGVTLMGEADVPEWTIQQRVGHTSVETTRAYAHPAVELQRVAAEALSALLGIGSEDRVIDERPSAGRS